MSCSNGFETKFLTMRFFSNFLKLKRVHTDQTGEQAPVLQQDGRPPQDGPPDLEQIWQDFNQKLSRFFGGSGNGGGRKPEMRDAGIGVMVVLSIVGLLWVSSGFFWVESGKVAIITTFGKFERTSGPGFNWRWPTPIQSHEIVDTQLVRQVDIGSPGHGHDVKESLMLTDDQNIVNLQFSVQYSLTDAVKWLYSNRDQENTVKQVAETAMREVVGRNTMDYVLYKGREQLAKDVQILMQEILNRYDTGVQVAQVVVQSVQPPEQVQAAFDDAVKAEQDLERQKNDGQAYANDILPKAEGTAAALIKDAEAYRAQVIANAEGDAARFKQVVAEYQHAPVVTRDRMYLDTMQQIFANTTKVYADSRQNSQLLYLPLDKLIAQTAIGDTAPTRVTITAPAPSAAAPAQESAVERSRDVRGRDTREREGR